MIYTKTRITRGTIPLPSVSRRTTKMFIFQLSESTNTVPFRETVSCSTVRSWHLVTLSFWATQRFSLGTFSCDCDLFSSCRTVFEHGGFHRNVLPILPPSVRMGSLLRCNGLGLDFLEGTWAKEAKRACEVI